MSFVLAPAAPTTPEPPAPSSTNDARSESDRSSTFGPALSNARERLSSTQGRRADAMDHRSSVRGPSERSTRPDRPDLPAADLNSNRPTRSATTDSNVEARTDRPVDEAADEVATSDEPATASLGEVTTEAPIDPNVATVGSLAIAANTLPSVTEAAVDGDASIDLTVDEVPEPGPSTRLAEMDATVIADGVTNVDIEAMAGQADATRTEVAEMGRQAALTSLEQVSDADLGLADRIRPAPTEEAAGPTVLADSATRSDPFGGTPSEQSVENAGVQGRSGEINPEIDPGRDSAEASTDGIAEDTPEGMPVQGTVVEVDGVERLTQQTSIGTVTRTDAPDSVVVAAREAGIAPDNVRAGPTSTTPAAAPLPEAEANLWEDVRSAFDRIRSTGDGQEVRMRLRPAELGELLVQVRTQGDHVSVRLVASSAGAQQTLIDDRLRLAAELARAGFDEGSVDIGQSNTGDTSQRGDDNGNRGETHRQPLGMMAGTDHLDAGRDIFERREPIRTDSGFRPGRTAQSTINLTL